MRARWYVAAFGSAEAALLLADVWSRDIVVLTAAYAVPLLVLALVAEPRVVMPCGVVTVALAAVSGYIHGSTGDSRHIVRVAIVLAGALVAVAFALARTRLSSELARQRELTRDNERLMADVQTKEGELRAIVAGMADAVFVHDAQGRPVYANQAAADILGLPSVDAVLAAGPNEVPGRFDFSAETGEPATMHDLPGRRIFAGERDPPEVLLRSVDRRTGREMWTVTKATAITDRDGRPVLAVNVILDVTESRRRAAAAELLARAGELLGASLDLEDIPGRITSLVVPDLADWCGLLQERRGTPRRSSAGRVMAYANLEAPQLDELVRDPGQREQLTAMDACHLVIVGIGDGGGALVLARRRTRAAFAQDELQMIQELARRAGTAVLNARLYLERTLVADTLQRSLLPPQLPEPEGLQMAAHYRAAGLQTQVGGDFYDAFQVPDGWLVVIGDVTGKGAAAAALTGLARSAMESVATLTGRPGLALAHLHDLLARRGDMALASVAAVHLHAGEEPLTASVFSAGHPPVLLLRDGTVTALEVRGSLLGAFPDQQWEPVEVQLRVGDVLVLRTDGVTDTVGAEGRLGEDRLRAVLVGSTPGDARGAVDRVRALVQDFQEGEARDDVAVLAVAVVAGTVRPAPDTRVPLPSLATRVTLDGTAASVARARAAVDEHLAAVLPSGTVEAVRLLVSELASNAVRHAGGGDYVLDLDLDPLRLRVELCDSGPGPVAAASAKVRATLPEGGYGLGIVDRLASRWGVIRGEGPTPTRVWFELERAEDAVGPWGDGSAASSS